MDTKTKIFEITLAIVILVGIASIPFTSSNQSASLASFFGPDNTNETVLKAQTKLNEMGLYDGNLSGLFGLKTRFAIYRFQEATGLARTGILDIPTQRSLFSFEIEPEYLDVSYTNEGNTFLADWARYILGVEGKRVELRGKLTLIQQDATYQNLSTRLVLEDELGGMYSIFNISFRDLDQFIDKNVVIRGLAVYGEANLGLGNVLINHIESGEEDFPSAVGFSEEGNAGIKKWINKVYQEDQPLTGLIGTISSAGRPTRYAPGGNYTQFMLSTDEGVEYNIENISSDSLSAFVNREVMIRGAVLNNISSSGRKTIVINYVLFSE